MSNEKNYKYYRVEGPDVKALVDSHKPIAEQRGTVLKQLLDDSGAAGYTLHSGLSIISATVSDLAFKHDHPFPCEVTVRRQDMLDDTKVVIVKGKGRSKEVKEFNGWLNGLIDTANSQLKNLPSFFDYMISHYNVHCSTLGDSTGRGMAILCTYGGLEPGRDDSLLFAIPQVKEGERDRQPEIPAGFVEITYGQFYDSIHK